VKKTTARKRVPARPRTQQQPTPERNKEIQQALLDKGYLQDPPTGVWDTQSSEALKRFQTDQQLQATGKLDSLSLIRLGLGPKRQALTPASLPNPPAKP
jgi:peptidoglycan hydrolase-like protein with peptidoglycan-binding domain